MLTFLGARFLSRNQIALYEALMYRAITDPKFAKKLLEVRGDINSPDYLEKVQRIAAEAGINVKEALRAKGAKEVDPYTISKTATRPATADVLIPDSPQEFPVNTNPEPQAQTQPVLPSMDVVTPTAPTQRSPDFIRSYEALFPDDPIVPMLEQRKPPQQ